MSDLMAGIIVGIVALPLAIAFGIASGVTPEKGIITAIVAGLAETRSDGNDNHAHHTDEGTPRVDGIETLEVNAPFLDKVRRIAG